MTPELQDCVFARLSEASADQPWVFTILAALDGAAALDAYLDGTRKPELPLPEASAAVTPGEPPGVYVASVTVEGFRGIGAAVTLSLPPGPGLVLVVGRNGSGKSSFAEALELLLTGRNLRWEKRSKAWQEGWRNLHHPGRISLKADLLVEGEGLLTTIRGWQPNGDLPSSDAAVVRPGQSARPLDEMGWRRWPPAMEQPKISRSQP